jgi:hypothetical protein
LGALVNLSPLISVLPSGNFRLYFYRWELSYSDVRNLFYLVIVISANNQLPGVAFYHLIRNRRMNLDILATHLISRDALLSSAQYYRLMAMSMALGIWGVGWISLSVGASIAGGSDPLPSWKAIHSDDSTVFVVPTLDLTPGSIAINVALWWAVPSAAYLYFLLFGSNREVLSDYQNFWIWFKTRVLRQTVPVNSSTPMNPAGYVLLLTICQISWL